MTRVIAVSGGVDSVALLHMLSQQYPAEKFIVAHFDHGIREDSGEDALFVAELAKKYNYKFLVKREELGKNAGEALARERRYAFLHDVATNHNASLITAHHLDDLVETVAINFSRGTGWRGLAPFNATIERPLIDMTKAQILEYAREYSLEWREDSTNEQDIYLRNRLRQKTRQLSEGDKRTLHALYVRQKKLRREIRDELTRIIGDNLQYDRYFVTNAPESVAMEYLRAVTQRRLTRPQLLRLLHAVKVAKPGAIHSSGNGVFVHFTTRYFTVELIKLIG